MSTLTEQAATLGHKAGHAAATWVFDGNTTDETYQTFLRGWEDGDPLILDQFAPATGWLSGEFDDTPTPQTLAADLGIGDDHTHDEVEGPLGEACTAYEAAADEAFWQELERVAILQTRPGED